MLRPVAADAQQISNTLTTHAMIANSLRACSLTQMTTHSAVHLIHGHRDVLFLPQEGQAVVRQRYLVLRAAGEPVHVGVRPVLCVACVLRVRVFVC